MLPIIPDSKLMISNEPQKISMLTPEEDDFRNRFEQQQRESFAKNLEHHRLMADYKENRLRIPDILWHRSIDEIDLSLQPDRLVKGLLAGGLELIAEVDIEILIDRMTKADQRMFRKRKLYNPSFNGHKISSVIYSWQQGQRLIPPTILIYNKEFAETLENSNFESTEDLRPQDGKHRINAAYCLGATNIPILVRNRQLDLIKKILFS